MRGQKDEHLDWDVVCGTPGIGKSVDMRTPQRNILDSERKVNFTDRVFKMFYRRRSKINSNPKSQVNANQTRGSYTEAETRNNAFDSTYQRKLIIKHINSLPPQNSLQDRVYPEKVSLLQVLQFTLH